MLFHLCRYSFVLTGVVMVQDSEGEAELYILRGAQPNSLASAAAD